MENKKKIFELTDVLKWTIVAIFFLLTVFLVSLLFLEKKDTWIYYFPGIVDNRIEQVEGFKKFNDETEFRSYLEKAEEIAENYRHSFDRTIEIRESDAISAPTESIAKSPERYSETNVQVQGIDEPDIVKTDGENVYISIEEPYYWIMPMRDVSSSVAPDYYPQPPEKDNTKIAKAFPVEEMENLSEIEQTGEMLLKDDVLVIFGREKISGYDVSNPNNPQEIWDVKIGDDALVVDARLYGDSIYLVVSHYAKKGMPCVIKPITINGKEFDVSCTNIYYPERTVPVNATYSVVELDVNSGEARNDISFVGSAENSVIYVSPENIYVSYYKQESEYVFLAGLLKDAQDIVPSSVIESIEILDGYDISIRAKMTELQVIIEDWIYSLDSDEEMRIENEIKNRMPKYYKDNMRDLETTIIMKIGLTDLKVKAGGEVPGSLLNQFAMDEYQGNLRVATTIGEKLWWVRSYFSWNSTTMTANDVYALDSNLKEVGSVKDLGLGERIYSARFIGDVGYLVTFREIDPFYILDLSNPNNPEMKGELKIPGYSSYLHPISDDIVLGIGKEDWKVKASLFDVSNPYDPREIDKYILDEHWSDAVDNHRAFLIDSKHEIFFLPGGKGAYVFSFTGDKLSLVRTVRENNIKRAIYIDDYLYVISANKIIVLDQNTWERVTEMEI